MEIWNCKFHTKLLTAARLGYTPRKNNLVMSVSILTGELPFVQYALQLVKISKGLYVRYKYLKNSYNFECSRASSFTKPGLRSRIKKNPTPTPVTFLRSDSDSRLRLSET